MAETRADGKASFAAVTLDVAADLDVLSASIASGLELVSYWEQPDAGIAVAALGTVTTRTASDAGSTFELVELLSRQDTVVSRSSLPPIGPWFGGVAFDLNHAPQDAWSGFPVSRWVLPEFLLVRANGVAQLTGFAECSVTVPLPVLYGELEARVGALSERLRGPARLRDPAGIRTVREDRGAWDRLIQSALAAIDGERLLKVVAARGIAVECGSAVPVPTVIDRLRKNASNCTTFLVRGDDGGAFVGATPELLCAVEASRVETVALGGSRTSEDVNWPSDKELREHGAIVEGISQALRPLCSDLSVPERPGELHLRRLSHLQSPIHGALLPRSGVADVLRALHPTPAVGGTPRTRALDFLREHEGLERGWYAGAVGWIGAGKAELRVALRCALIRNDQAHVFVGAGIVAGSDADAEWIETAAKARTALTALGAADAA